ncbi:17228_t:CDS:2 [Funneliformis geosporum]|uniref:17228_t:CDS:1 n=1 Tax=Funneliformis geosporum TaxID=1117311 RepID=A0A9W4WHA1_9GLOM|nr:17228_t:CDS:2 [Funneliformis geosporum]
MDLHLMVWIDNFTSFYMGDKYSDIQIFEYIRGCEIKYPSTEVEFKVKTVLKIFTLREILFNRTKSNPDLMQKLNLISFLLFKTFIKYDASLHKLHLNIKFSYPNQHMSEFYELILNNQNFFSKLKYFTLGLEKNNIVTQEYLEQSILFQHFLSHLPKICTSIKYLELNIPYDIYIQLLKEIKNLFKSQKDLLKIQSVYGGKKNNLTEYLPFCSNTLTTINFYTIFFSNEISFNGLERLTHIKCLEFQHCVEEFFESIIQNCERIKFFHLTAIEHSHIPQLFRLITLLNDHLKYLTLEDFTKEELRFEVLTQEIKQFVTMKDYKDWVIKPSLLDGTLN